MAPMDRVRYLQADPRQSSRWPPGRAARGTLVLVHAFPLSAGMWEPQFALADHGWHVVAPQLRGFGVPPAEVSATTTMDDYASDVADILADLGAGPAVIGGLSMGGYVALALFRRAPELFRGLVLADTRADADSDDVRANRQRMTALTQSHGSAAVADAMVPKLLGATTRATQPELDAHVRELIHANAPAAIVAALHAMMTRGDSSAWLARIGVPTLVLVGSEDTLTPPSLSASMAASIPASELVVVPAAGHLTNLEQPQAFNAALTQFLHRL